MRDSVAIPNSNVYGTHLNSYLPLGGPNVQNSAANTPVGSISTYTGRACDSA